MNTEEYIPARLSDDYGSIIDSNGCSVAYEDPRVVHVLTDITNPLTVRLVQAVYAKHGKRCRPAGQLDHGVMQYAKTVCSGRECLPMISMAGGMVKDAKVHRHKDDICIYTTLDQEGPCQNGAWPLVWRSFCRRLNVKHLIPGINRNTVPFHLGLSDSHLKAINDSILLGDLFEEARNALTVAAQNPATARQEFDRGFARFTETLKTSDDSLDRMLSDWAEAVKRIPLSLGIAEVPKVLIIGGLNLMFVHEPVSAYLLEQGIAPKVVDVADGACWVESEGTIRLGFEKGLMTPGEQFTFKPAREDRSSALKIRRSRLGVKMIESRLLRFRAAMGESGLLFDRHHRYADVVAAGHPYASGNSFTETTATVGRFILSSKDHLYDGFVNLGAFNCQPAMNAQAILRFLAGRSDQPYVAIDCEGPWLSTSQHRLLETLSVRAKRHKADGRKRR